MSESMNRKAESGTPSAIKLLNLWGMILTETFKYLKNERLLRTEIYSICYFIEMYTF